MMNPILASGARRRMRTIKTPLIITIYLAALLAVMALSSLRVMGQERLLLRDMRSGVDGYIYLVGVQFVLILMVAPIMAAGGIAGERERQTLELLMVTNTGSFRIVMGKLMESFGFLALLVISSTPLMCTVLLFGGVTLAQVLTSVGFLLAVALSALSVGMFCSAICKRTVAAAILAYIILIAIGVGTFVGGLVIGVRTTNALMVASGGDYTAMTAAIVAMDENELLKLLPAPLLFNPALGIAVLLAGQTSLLTSTMSTMMGNFVYNILIRVNFEAILLMNIGCLLAGSALLWCLSALKVRPRVKARVSRGKA